MFNLVSLLPPDCTEPVGCPETGVLVSLVTDPEKKCSDYESGDCLPHFDTSEYTSIVSEVSKPLLCPLHLILNLTSPYLPIPSLL